jgi:hypothetical protein
MDIRIESNIGLELFEMKSIQNALVKLRETYSEAPLLIIRCDQNPVFNNEISILLTLFNGDKTEIITGVGSESITLLNHLLIDMINLKWKRDFPFTPIRINSSLKSAS